MSINKGKVGVDKKQDFSSECSKEIGFGYWIHVNHILNCYADCQIYVNSFDHFVKTKKINKCGLILVPLNHAVHNISCIIDCLLCDNYNGCWICHNFTCVCQGRRSMCNCNEDLRDDHAVTRINWFISNFKMCATMKERFKPNNPKFLKQKNDNNNKQNMENGTKNNIKVNKGSFENAENRQKVEPSENDKTNSPSHPAGVVKKYSKLKTKTLNGAAKLKENVFAKSTEVRADDKDIDKKNLNSCVNAVDTQGISSKMKVCESLASDIQILTKDSFTRFVDKYESVGDFGSQCLFCKVLGYFYDGKFCDLIIPDFCIIDRRQITCDKSVNERDCFGKQYCLSLENAFEELGMGPKLIGTFSKKHIPLIDLDRGMGFDKNSKYLETGLSKSKVIKIKKKSPWLSYEDEMLKGEETKKMEKKSS